MCIFRIKFSGNVLVGMVKVVYSGISVWVVLLCVLCFQIEIECVLGEIFVYEDKYIIWYGVLFNWLSVVVGYIQVFNELSDEVVECYYLEGI